MLGLDLFRKKIDVFISRDRVEGVVEHAADVVLAIVDDFFRFFIPQHRHGDAAIEVRIGRGVGFTEKFETVDRIDAVTGSITKGPAALVANWIDNGHVNGVLESFQLSEDDGPTCPRTSERDIKMITAGRARVRCRSITRNPFAESIFLALKFSGVRYFRRELRVHS